MQWYQWSTPPAFCSTNLVGTCVQLRSGLHQACHSRWRLHPIPTFSTSWNSRQCCRFWKGFYHSTRHTATWWRFPPRRIVLRALAEKSLWHQVWLVIENRGLHKSWSGRMSYGWLELLARFSFQMTPSRKAMQRKYRHQFWLNMHEGLRNMHVLPSGNIGKLLAMALQKRSRYCSRSPVVSQSTCFVALLVLVAGVLFCETGRWNLLHLMLENACILDIMHRYRWLDSWIADVYQYSRISYNFWLYNFSIYISEEKRTPWKLSFVFFCVFQAWP